VTVARGRRRGAGVTLLAAVALLLSARGARAACDGAQAVALDIDSPRDVALRRSIERHVAAELRSESIGVCAAPARPVLATLSIRAPRPEQPLAAIRVSRAGAAPLERELDVSGFPPEARALAIASAADELLRAALAAPPPVEQAPAATDPPPAVPVASPAAERAAVDRAPGDAVSDAAMTSAGRFELGLAGAASSIFGQRDALGADLTARYWLTPRVALDARLGVTRRLTRPTERGAVQPAHDVHAVFGAGYELWRTHAGLGVVAGAGVELARAGFDEAIGGAAIGGTGDGGFVNIAVNTVSEVVPLDASWWLLARAGLEGRYRRGAIGMSLALTALVPIVPAESDWGDTTSLDRVGAEVSAGVWLALGRTE